MVTQPIADETADDVANDLAMNVFTRLDPRSHAFLLDVDGTLIDLGSTPDDVDVPDELRRSLARLLELTGGALALVSGRPIVDIDRLFAPLTLPAIGGHGAEMRVQGNAVISATKPLPEDLRRHLADAATPGSGVIFEDKGYSFALHYRNGPQHEERLRSHIANGRAAFPGEATHVLLGKSMFEVMRPGVSKGDAVRELMTHAPFAGRTPVFIGDDVTDETVFAVLPELGGKGSPGLGFSVGRHFPKLAGTFHSPAQVRVALQRLADDAQARSS